MPCGLFDDCTEHTVRQCISTIKKVPTIDAAPVVHGRWWQNDLLVGMGKYKKRIMCSECNMNIFSADELPYCPFCGARMDGGEGHEN